ncbi:VWA domain-containing protein [Desulfuromonas thiophila]|uniref:VWA domain-containing protein n=1 Tax=Desulfuromonas thiophila TaxID=57664 RepID=UPI0029F5AA7C|nr:VWA domain-containing protein [Desulfuromonas thiophila]
METILAQFVSQLRAEGLRVSPGESLDATRALAFGGIEQRNAFYSALRLTLVKKIADQPLFDRVFESFFRKPGHLPIDSLHHLHDAILTIQGDSPPGTNPDLINHEMSLAMVESGLSPEDVKDLLQLREVDFELDGTEVEVRMKGYRGSLEAPRPSMRIPQSPPITMSFNQNGGQGEKIIFSAEEIEVMEDAVARMVMRIKKDIRRVKNKENRGKIHVIRTLQKNYRNGMVPFVLSLRRRRKQKPRLVVLCDVSFSVSHASRFMLLLLYTLHNRLMDVRSFIFNAELAEITDLLSNAPINATMADINKGELVDLDENSDYGNVLMQLKEKVLENLRGRPAVIVLGDARNNYQENNAWIFEQLREKAGYMLWLTPEERDSWQRGDCEINKYGAYFDKVEVVKSVEELNGIVEDLFRNIYLEEIHRSKIIQKQQEQEVHDYRSYYRRGKEEITPELDPTARSHW